ncbi:unnamed protein product, partial [marine sediment metagenome]
YEEFFQCIANLRDICTDVVIKDGIIRQRTDDKNSIFEMDLTDLFGEAVNIPISYFKQRFDLFKVFIGQEVTVKIHEDEEDPGSSWYEISDSLSRIKFDFPGLEFLQNEFITEEELAAIFTCGEDDLILETQIEKTITERIKTITTNFQSHFVKMDFSGESLSIGAIDPAKTNRVFFLENLAVEMNFDEPHYSNMTRIPFMINHDTAYTFQLYKQPDEMLTQNKITTSIGTVPIKIYCKSQLISEDG